MSSPQVDSHLPLSTSDMVSSASIHHSNSAVEVTQSHSPSESIDPISSSESESISVWSRNVPPFLDDHDVGVHSCPSHFSLSSNLEGNVGTSPVTSPNHPASNSCQRITERDLDDLESGPLQLSPRSSYSFHEPDDFAVCPSFVRTTSQIDGSGSVSEVETATFPNLLSLYGTSTSRQRSLSSSTLAPSVSVSRVNSVGSGTFETLGTLGLRKRYDSLRSMDTVLMEPEDPRMADSGINKNEIKMLRKERRRRENNAMIESNIVSMTKRREFVLKLAKALLFFGAPSHRIESQLVAVSRVLDLRAHFVHLPTVVICTFGDPDIKTTQTRFVKSNGRIDLGKLHNVHDVYRMVCRDEISAETGTIELCNLLKSPPVYGLRMRIFFAFLCASIICPMAFGGTLVEMGIAGLFGATLAFLQLYVTRKSSLYADIFEISIVVVVSFISRILAGIPGQKFCYQSISTAGVVLILPGYLILASSLELASKNMLCGSVRMVYAIIYSLFLGFGLTIGSDLGLLVNAHLRKQMDMSTRELAQGIFISGNFTSDASMSPMIFTFANATHLVTSNIIKGCYRGPEWSWYYKPFPEWTLAFLVPLYTFFSISWNLQPWRSKQVPAMIIISCCSYTANRLANRYILARSDVVSAIGAFFVGILGNLYSRILGGTAFTAMLPGVLALVPSGLAAAGGFAHSYRGKNSDLYSASIMIGIRMIQVAIGITVGLFTSGLLVYSIGRRKKSALFAF